MIRDKVQFFKWNIENIIISIIKHWQMNQILELNNPKRVVMPLNKPNLTQNLW